MSMPVATGPQKFIRWCVASLQGHFVLFGLLVSVPTFVAFFLKNYLSGTLGPDLALKLVIGTVLEDVAIAVPIWYVITRPRIEWMNRQRSRGGSVLGVRKPKE
jgi:hypothetical protein